MNAKQFAQTDAARDIEMEFAHMCCGSISFKADETINGKSVIIYATFYMDDNTYKKLDVSYPTLRDLMLAEFEITFYCWHTNKPLLEV